MTFTKVKNTAEYIQSYTYMYIHTFFIYNSSLNYKNVKNRFHLTIHPLMTINLESIKHKHFEILTNIRKYTKNKLNEHFACATKLIN